MSQRTAVAPAGPAVVDFEPVHGGFDHRWTEWILDTDLSTATVEVHLRTENSTALAPVATLTDGNGLVIAVGGNAPADPPRNGDADSSIQITVPAEVAQLKLSEAVWYMLVVTLDGGVSTPYKVGKIPYTWRVVR